MTKAKSKRGNSIHKGSGGNPASLKRHGNTDHLFNAEAPKRTIQRSDESAERGKRRRACETIQMARELGNELLEVWDT